MKLELTTAWTKLNDKFTNKFGAFVRHGSDVEITYETTPVASTQGKVYSLHQTIKVDPAIEMYVRSLGKESVLTLDENFYEEEGSSSSSDNINAEIECKFKIEHKQYEDEGTTYDVPSLEIYDFNDQPIIFDITKKYFGKIIDIESYAYTDTKLRVNVNNDYYYIELNGFYDTSSTTTSDLYLDDILLNQTFEIKFDSNSDVVITNQDYINLLNVSENIPTNVSQNQIKNIIETRINTQKRSPTTFNASNVATNNNLLIFLTSAWYSNNTVIVRNLKFPNYNFAGASGNIYGNMYFDFVRSSINVPIEAYFLKVTITFQSPVNNISKLERFFSLNFNNVTQKYTISISEIFYDESKWTFYKTGFSEITNVGMFPISEWVNWVKLDTQAKSVIITLEYVGTCTETFTIPINALRARTEYSLSIGGNWFILRINGANIQFRCPSNGSSGTIVKVNNACFLYDY